MQEIVVDWFVEPSRRKSSIPILIGIFIVVFPAIHPFKVHLKKPAELHYLAQVGKERGDRYTIK